MSSYYSSSASSSSSSSESEYSSESERTNPKSYARGEYHNAAEDDVVSSDTADYTLMKKLGTGQFSKVWYALKQRKPAEAGHETSKSSEEAKCEAPTTTVNDHTTDEESDIEFTALKICRSHECYQEMIQHEYEIMKQLGTHDHIVHLLDFFHLDGPNGNHPVFALPACGMDLFSLIHLYDFKEAESCMPLPIVKRVVQQLLAGIVYLAENNVVHTDLKPENILLETYCEHRDAVRLEDIHVRVTDFGSAIRVGERAKPYGHTLEYRAPELIFSRSNLKPASDVWSIGCIMWDLLTGNFLFSPRNSHGYRGRQQSSASSETSHHTNHEHLCLMVELFGAFPKNLGKRIRGDYFNSKGELKRVRNSIGKVELHEILVEDYEYDTAVAQQISNFLQPLFRYNPLRRVQARQVLASTFLTAAEENA
jgi:serine/threonine-protein kinase SRPK3